MKLTLHLDIHAAISHFAIYGITAVLDQEFPKRVRTFWSAPDKAEILILNEDLSREAIARLLHNHAVNHAQDDSWVQATHEHNLGKSMRTIGLFSPRVPVAGSQLAWEEHQIARLKTLKGLFSKQDWLSLAFIHALGEPAYWFANYSGGLEPDRGASGWEMKTRNRGEEFVQNRLALLARKVSERTPETVLSGVTGLTHDDEVGKNALDSRTPSGLTPPAPTDNALAWFALWGISLFPTVHRAAPALGRPRQHGRPSITTAQIRRSTNVKGLSNLRRAWIGLPIFNRPTRLSTIKNVLLSSQLAKVTLATAMRHLGGEPAITSAPEDASYLQRKGVQALLFTYQEATDNPNAPEFWVPSGMLSPLRVR